MMTINKGFLYLIFLFFFSQQNIFAQDLHFTNYTYAPQYLNPAQIGSFFGTARFNGIYRSQFSSFINEPYVTTLGSGDVNLMLGLRKRDWTSIGIAVFYDKAGELSLQNTGALLGVGYHMAMDKKRNKVFTIGAQASMFQRRIDGAWNPEDLIISGTASADQGLFENFNGNNSGANFNVGLQYNSKLSKTNHFEMGVGMYHLLQPTEKENIAPRRLTAHANLFTKASKKVNLEYALYFSTATSVNNVMFQVKSHFNLSKTKRVKRKKVTIERGEFMFGLGYRFNDALLFLTGYEYKKWQFGVSYDMTVSSASTYNNYYGAIELGLTRTFLIQKRPDIKPVLICPTL